MKKYSASNVTYLFRIIRMVFFIGALVFAKLYAPLREFIDGLETANRILFFVFFILFVYIITFIFEKFFENL
jgi:hypothetical protein